MAPVIVVLGLILVFGLLLWISDIGTDFMDRMERARESRPFDFERDL
jgi:hypothetical protein